MHIIQNFLLFFRRAAAALPQAAAALPLKVEITALPVAHAVFHGRAVFLRFEKAAEIVDALEAHKVCDLADAGVGVHQKLLGLAQADTVDVADGRGAVHLLEDADERCFVDAARVERSSRLMMRE